MYGHNAEQGNTSWRNVQESARKWAYVVAHMYVNIRAEDILMVMDVQRKRRKGRLKRRLMGSIKHGEGIHHYLTLSLSLSLSLSIALSLSLSLPLSLSLYLSLSLSLSLSRCRIQFGRYRSWFSTLPCFLFFR